jgi:hypothetical protein
MKKTAARMKQAPAPPVDIGARAISGNERWDSRPILR